MEISVVIPLLNETESIPELGNALRENLLSTGKSFELIFVDDGSTDGSTEQLIKLKESIPEIKIIQFQKNHGKSAALSAGFEMSAGERVVTIDADLQDEPKEIINLLQKLEEGYDLVSGWKKNRQDPFIKRITSKLFNFVTSLTTGVRLHDHNCGLKAYRKVVIDNLSVYGELHRYIPALVYSYGFKVTEIEVTHHNRRYGKTKYGSWRFFAGFFDLLTVLFLTKYTSKPLHLFGIIGLISFSLGILINMYLTVLKYFYAEGIGNRPLLFLGILLILVGFQFVSLGFIAEMISSFSNKDKKYIIRKSYD